MLAHAKDSGIAAAIVVVIIATCGKRGAPLPFGHTNTGMLKQLAWNGKF